MPAAAIVDRARHRDRDLAHAPAQLGRDRRRRVLDQLLVAALQRAVAFAEVDRVAVRIGEDLDLDVARPLDGALEQQPGVAERALGLGRRRSKRGVEPASLATSRMPRPPPPATAFTIDR